MKQKRWRVLLWIAFVVMVLCAVRDVRRSAASKGAQRIEVRAGRAPADRKQMDARLQNAGESKDENNTKGANESQQRLQQAAREAQRM
jgi:preprotein translocase subunit SecF